MVTWRSIDIQPWSRNILQGRIVAEFGPFCSKVNVGYTYPNLQSPSQLLTPAARHFPCPELWPGPIVIVLLPGAQARFTELIGEAELAWIWAQLVPHLPGLCSHPRRRRREAELAKADKRILL